MPHRAAIDPTRIVTMPAPAWTVLLIGGNSGAGKTSVAQCIGRRLGVNVAQADTYRLLADRVTAASTTRSGPPEPSQTAEERCAVLQRRATTLAPMLEIVTAYHVATRAPLILEGDCLLPAFATQRLHAYVPVAKKLRAIFLLDSDEASLATKQQQRGRGFSLQSAEHQRVHVAGDLLYAEWLRASAIDHGCTVLEVGGRCSADDYAMQIIGQLQLGQTAPLNGVA